MSKFFTAFMKTRKRLYLFEFTEIALKYSAAFQVNMKGDEIHSFSMIQKGEDWKIDSPFKNHWIYSFELELSEIIKRNTK